MDYLMKIFGNDSSDPEGSEKSSTNLAFVLLSEAHSPDTEAIIRVFRLFASSDQEIQLDGSESASDSDSRIATFKFNSGERSFVALMPVAIPNGEADEGAKFSLYSITSNWVLPPHCAHLVVTFQSTLASPPIDRLSLFTSLLAAVVKVSPSVGVYWGGSGATHESNFFISVASDRNHVARVMLWSGVSIAREKDGRLSLLSLGMSQLDLPNMYIVAGKASEVTAMETMFDLLSYVAQCGKQLPDGDTIGRTEHERLVVRYVPSPIDSSSKVMRVELP